jgi:hypothetical protein
MYRQEIEDKQGTAGVLVAADKVVLDKGQEQEGEKETSGGTLLKFPSGYFFKGFLAWCLWGHIPIHNHAIFSIH